MLSRLYADPKEPIQILPIGVKWGHHCQPSGFYSTFWTVTCTERLTANPSERRPWQGTWRELTTTGFLRVGLGWIYLPNAPLKSIPNTSFALFANYFFKQNERISPGWFLAAPKQRNRIDGEIRESNPRGNFRGFFPERESEKGLRQGQYTCATQHPKNQYQNHGRPFYQDLGPALGLHCLKVKHPVFQVQTQFRNIPGLFLAPDVPRPEGKGWCHRGAGDSGNFFWKENQLMSRHRENLIFLVSLRVLVFSNEHLV
jgi:hypothetical protein